MQTLRGPRPLREHARRLPALPAGRDLARPGAERLRGGRLDRSEGQETDLILFGKHFSIQETNVVVGGVYLLLANLDNPTAASSSPPAGGDSSGSAQSGAAKSSTTAGAAKAPTPPAASNPGTTSSNPAIDIVSREVMRIHLPANVKPTDIYDADRKTSRAYVEIYVATPTGISNRLLVPYKKAKDADAKSVTAQVGFDLNAKDSAEMDVSVQWIHDADDRYSLVASEDPSAGDKKPLHITWDSPVGFAPRTLLATFEGTVNSQAVKFALEASAGLKDDYSVDRRFIALELLKQLQTIVVAPPTLPPDSVTMTVSVQPYIPTDSMGYRVISAAKPLKTQLTVKFSPKITNKCARRRDGPRPAPTSSQGGRIAGPRNGRRGGLADFSGFAPRHDHPSRSKGPNSARRADGDFLGRFAPVAEARDERQGNARPPGSNGSSGANRQGGDEARSSRGQVGLGRQRAGRQGRETTCPVVVAGPLMTDQRRRAFRPGRAAGAIATDFPTAKNPIRLAARIYRLSPEDLPGIPAHAALSRVRCHQDSVPKHP